MWLAKFEKRGGAGKERGGGEGEQDSGRGGA